MKITPAKVEWTPGKRVSLWAAGSSKSEFIMILAHGAGSNANHPLTVGLRDELVAAGAFCVTFNYPYAEEGRRWPDRTDRLLACHRAVSAWVMAETGKTPVLAGRSMGGRMGSYLASDGDPGRALVLYAYPLHPPGRPERLRSEHLSNIRVPMLFFRGSRDAFSRSDLFDREIRSLKTATVVDLEGLDHSFRGRGKRIADVNRSIAQDTIDWLGALAE